MLNKNGVNVIGMPFGEHGLGQCLRDRVKGLLSAAIPVTIIEMNYSSLKARAEYPHIEMLCAERPVHEINLWCLNLPMLQLAHRDAPEVFAERYNIVAPFWEFEELPERHSSALQYVDEVWVPTSFLESLFVSYTDKPVTKLPLYVSIDQCDHQADRSAFGLPSDDFLFLYVFDANSLVGRKDPEAAILAFLDAFQGKPEAPVGLVLKYKYEAGKSLRMDQIDHMKRLARKDPRIRLLEGHMSRPQTLSLINSCDAYVSPHRAEGLGRTIVEAMLLGKPVAATEWSGNADFTVDDHAIPLDYAMIDVGFDAVGDIAAEYRWALCDHESLVAAMRKLVEDPQFARQLGARAASFMSANCGPSIFGAAAASRLQEVGASGSLVTSTHRRGPIPVG